MLSTPCHYSAKNTNRHDHATNALGLARGNIGRVTKGDPWLYHGNSIAAYVLCNSDGCRLNRWHSEETTLVLQAALSLEAVNVQQLHAANIVVLQHADKLHVSNDSMAALTARNATFGCDRCVVPYVQHQFMMLISVSSTFLERNCWDSH